MDMKARGIRRNHHALQLRTTFITAAITAATLSMKCQSRVHIGKHLTFKMKFVLNERVCPWLREGLNSWDLNLNWNQIALKC